MPEVHPLEELQRKAAEVSSTLRLLANEKRLLALCRLAQAGEMPVGALSEAVGLSQSALSQHLSLLRAGALVGTRRDAQTLYYRIADARVLKLLECLRELYC
jgi:ArsR family transcriptional regulator